MPRHPHSHAFILERQGRPQTLKNGVSLNGREMLHQGPELAEMGVRGGKRALRKMELLAPAGTREAFFSAIENGADAVYVGLKTLNARALATNFSLAEVAALTSLAHEAGVRLFVALNSLVKETELPMVMELLAGLHETGVDALIIQDLAVWRLARRYFPDLRLHASTLMAIHNSWGVRQAYQMGFKRVVLAREMTLHEIQHAVNAADVEIEVFVHGAMCFTCSGSCLMSSYFGGKSSMRGRCVQPCRRQYEVNGAKGFHFSMFDLCGIDVLPELADMGVASIKIEGRLKPASYVGGVVRAYRMLLNALPLRNTQPEMYQDVLKESKALLNAAMGRDYTGGFFRTDNPKDLLDAGRTANTGKYLGRVMRSKNSTLCIKSDSIVQKGDRLRIVFPDVMEQLSFTCHAVERDGDGLFCISNARCAAVPVNSLVFKTDQRAQQALGAPFFDTSSWKDCWQGLVSKGRIYERRAHEKAAQLQKELSGQHLSRPCKKVVPLKRQGYAMWVRLKNPAMLELARALNPRGIIVELDAKYMVFFLRHWRNDICWSIPAVSYENGLHAMEQQILRLLRMGHRSFMVNNLSQIEWLQHLAKDVRGHGLELWSGYAMNLLNSQALQAVRDLGVKNAMFSVETDERNLSLALSNAGFMPVSMTVFGYLPLFVSRIKPFERPERVVIASPRGEMFWWRNTPQTGCCLPDKPFSLFDLQERLQEMGVTVQVIDLMYWPAQRRLPEFRKRRDWTRAFYMGRRFNFADNLL
jgi:putative protease